MRSQVKLLKKKKPVKIMPTSPRNTGRRTVTRTCENRGSLPEIRLRERRVHWDTNVVDNENLGRKKSNVCCIFHARNPEQDPNSPCFDPEDDSEAK
jgi:hypothetical protein